MAGWGGYLSEVAKEGVLKKAYLDAEEAAITMEELDRRLFASNPGLKTVVRYGKGGNWKGNLSKPGNRILAYANYLKEKAAETPSKVSSIWTMPVSFPCCWVTGMQSHS